MTDDETVEDTFDQIKPILTGLDCGIVGTVLVYLTANWLISIEADPPDRDDTRAARMDALEQLTQQILRLVREDEDMREKPQ